MFDPNEKFWANLKEDFSKKFKFVVVLLTLILGWEIIKCHITAWKASQCGVTFLLFTVGINIDASAICLVYPPSLPTTPTIFALVFFAYFICDFNMLFWCWGRFWEENAGTPGPITQQIIEMKPVPPLWIASWYYQNGRRTVGGGTGGAGWAWSIILCLFEQGKKQPWGIITIKAKPKLRSPPTRYKQFALMYR